MPHNIPIEAPRWLAMYEHLAETLSDGYDLCIFEYTNDMSSRELLERYKEHPLVKSMQDRIQIADARIRFVLSPTKQCIHGQAPPAHFWYWMYPPNSPRLERDLKQAGAID